MDYTFITIILLTVFIVIELLVGQIFITKKAGFPSRSEDKVKYWYHIGFHLIVILAVAAPHFFGS